jgi:hypothetical protein
LRLAQPRAKRPLRLLGDGESPPEPFRLALQRLGVLDERRDVVLVLLRYIRQVSVVSKVRGGGGDRRARRITERSVAFGLSAASFSNEAIFARS